MSDLNKDIEIIKKMLTWTDYETTIREYEAQAMEYVILQERINFAIKEVDKDV